VNDLRETFGQRLRQSTERGLVSDELWSTGPHSLDRLGVVVVEGRNPRGVSGHGDLGVELNSPRGRADPEGLMRVRDGFAERSRAGWQLRHGVAMQLRGYERVGQGREQGVLSGGGVQPDLGDSSLNPVFAQGDPTSAGPSKKLRAQTDPQRGAVVVDGRAHHVPDLGQPRVVVIVTRTHRAAEHDEPVEGPLRQVFSGVRTCDHQIQASPPQRRLHEIERRNAFGLDHQNGGARGRRNVRHERSLSTRPAGQDRF
jgi:hypothetical protein